MNRRQFIGVNLAAAAAVAAQPWSIAAQSAPPDSGATWMNKNLSSAERARLLAAAMTPAEQAGQLLSYDGSDTIDSLAAKHIGCLYNMKGNRLAERARELRARHRLHVPVLFALDCVHGQVLAENLGGTIFPIALGMAASFDTEQIRRMGRITADEMIASGVRWTFGPNIDVAHDLRFGRIEEMFGEDPYLVGEMGAAVVEGLQGDFAHPRVIATAKHFTGYSAGIGGRDAAECPVSWRALRRDDFPPYRRVIQAGVRSVMSAYHAIDGTPCVINRRLLRDELRGELKFKGLVVSDANNARWCSLLQGITGSHEEFIVRAVEAGNEVHLAVMGVTDALVNAVKSGRLAPDVLRDAAALVLEAKFALGLFDEPDPVPKVELRTPESFHAAVDAAAASMVLLENHGALPLAPKQKRIALVGNLADDLRQQFGCWTSLCRNDKAADEIAKQSDAPSWTYLAGLRARAKLAGDEITYVPACGPAPGTTADEDAAGIAQAVAAAREADVIVAIVGDSDHWSGEGRDRADLNLPGRQQQLLEALHATGKPLIVVLAVTKPHTVPWVKANAAAVVCAWNSGMGGGAALAALLWGDRDFTGRTPVTWPAHVGQLPLTYDRIPGVHFEEFWFGPTRTPPNAPHNPSHEREIWRLENIRQIDVPAEYVFGVWPFGHGLSYAAINLTSAEMIRSDWQPGESPRLRVQLDNPGPRDGVAVVQVYVRDVEATVTRPDRRLAAWARVAVAAGQNATTEIEIKPAALEVVTAEGRRVIEPGTFHALVGFSSLVTELKVLPFTVG